MISDLAISIHGLFEAIGIITTAALAVALVGAAIDRLQYGPAREAKRHSPFLRALEQRVRRK